MIRRDDDALDVVVTVQHPAHVHFFRNVVDELERAGHRVFVFAREKDLTTDLLRAYDIPHTVLAGQADSLPGLVGVQLRYEWRLLRAARRIDPDVMMAIGGLAVSHVGKLLDARSVVFIDNEDVLSNYASVPVADVVCTPQRFESDYGDGHVRYPGYHELAYLHPEVFDPDPSVLTAHGVDHDRPYSVVRLVGWNAHHDVGEGGFSDEGRQRLVSTLAERGDVYVTSESPLPPAFEPYRLPVPSHVVHHLLASADLYVGDSQTMATEAAILGTPAVRSNSFAGDGDMSNFRELEERYGLLVSTPDEREAIRTVRQLLEDGDAANEWEVRRAELLAEKVNVTEFVVDLVAGFERLEEVATA